MINAYAIEEKVSTSYLETNGSSQYGFVSWLPYETLLLWDTAYAGWMEKRSQGSVNATKYPWFEANDKWLLKRALLWMF